MHRRILAALDARYDEIPEEVRDALRRRLRIVDLRGVTGIGLGPDLNERIARVVAEHADRMLFERTEPLSDNCTFDAFGGHEIRKG